MTLIICETAKDHLDSLKFDAIQQDSQVVVERFAATKETLLARTILECLSDCFLISKKESLEIILSEFLYPILCCVSSDHPLVSDAAWWTLHDLAVATGCENIQKLLESNLDLILHALSMRLQHYTLNPRSPLIFIAVLSQLSIDSITKLKPILDDLLHSLDENYAERSVQFVKVLLATLKSISIWFPESKPALNVAESMPDLDTESDEIMQSYEEDEKPILPPHIKLTLDIMHRSKHLLFSHSVPLRLAVLDTVSIGFAVLQYWQDERLPMIHQCWPGIAVRINDSNPYVALKAFELACCLAENSKSFMYRRIIDDVLPTICRKLKLYANESSKTGPVYQQTGIYKFQFVCLKRLTEMCNNVQLLEQDLSSVREVLDLYRAVDQPNSLNIAATECSEGFQPDNVE